MQICKAAIKKACPVIQTPAFLSCPFILTLANGFLYFKVVLSLMTLYWLLTSSHQSTWPVVCCKVSFKVPLPIIKLTTLKDVNCWMAQDIHNRNSGIIASILILVCLADATFAKRPLTLNVKFVFILVFIFMLNAGSCCSGWKLTFLKWGSVLYEEERRPHVKQAINSFPNWRKEGDVEQLLVLLPSSGSWSSVPIGNLHVFHTFFFCICGSWDLSSW